MRSQISVLCVRASTLMPSASALSPATARSWWESVRTMSASMWESPRSLLAPDTPCRSRYREACSGLTAYTVYPAAISAATHGPRSVSIPTSHLRLLGVLAEIPPGQLVEPGHPRRTLGQPRLSQHPARGVHHLHVGRSGSPGALPSPGPPQNRAAGFPRATRLRQAARAGRVRCAVSGAGGPGARRKQETCMRRVWS